MKSDPDQFYSKPRLQEASNLLARENHIEATRTFIPLRIEGF